MQGVLSPNGSSGLVSYASSSIECLERSDLAEDISSLISGSTFNNGRLAWLARGSALEVVNTSTGLREAAWRFGWSSRQKRAVVISAVIAFPMGDHDRLVVGLKDLSGILPGMVCLFDPYVSRVIKAIVVPYPVTTLESIVAAGGADAPPSLLSLHLKLFFGIVAVGTEQGHTYLLDMRLDDDMEEFDEWNPSQIDLVSSKEENIAVFREKARENGTHLGIELGGHNHKSGKFHYSKPELREKKTYPSGDIFITAVKYIRPTGCLVIGYNFGCFQIWDLSTRMLVYSSQVDQYEMSAITHFAYQEPENDPRSCSYLWVARGPLTAEDEPQLEVPTTLTLYQLIFNFRETLPGYGIVYKDLGGCGRRFEHQLTADAHHLADATSVGSKVICCYTLEKESISHDVSKADEVVTRDLTLMVCVWEAPSHDPLSSPLCHLGIFDVNRWYHSQMQPSIRDAMFGSKDSTCPFFAFFSLAEILDVANPDGIVDVYIDSKTVTRFKWNTEPALEQHFWPASLKFDTCCLMETGIVHSKFFGMQRQILSSLKEGGLASLSNAHEYFNMCWAAGLLPRNLDISKSQEKNFHLEAILSVSLEHGLITFITNCIQKLGAGNITHAGCSLRLILDWSWCKVVEIKEQLDQLCVPLFDGGGGTPDDQMLLMLDDMSVQLGHLKSIFQSLISQSAPSSQQGIKDLETKFQVVCILSTYLNLLLWLIRHGLLPEYNDDEDSAFQRDVSYSSASFTKFYDARRAELDHCGSELSSGGLMIDKIISQFDGLWVSHSGKEHYPPSSLHSLSSLYLLDKVSMETKHSIVFYLLLDICGTNEELNSLKIADRFAKAFNLPYNVTKMIRAFWFLDHKDFENAVNLLVDPSLATAEIGPWQNSYIIKSLLFQGQFQKVLYFINTVHPTLHTPEDVRLHLTVLVANGMVTEAFNFQRSHRDPSINTDLLFHFFTGCQQSGNISKAMLLPLNDVEEECFVQFLQQESFEAAKELLVMYYLQRGRYVEGVRLNEQLKKDTVNEQNPVILERTKVRNAIVDGYIQCLPSMQRKLIFTPDKGMIHQPTTLKEVPRPKPLSTVIHHAKQGRPVSHATILNSVMEKVAEARPPNTPQRRRSGAFVGTPVTPKTTDVSSASHRMVFAFLKKPEVVVEEPPKSSQSLLSTPSFLDKKSRRKQLYSGADALTLLTTPQIVKRSSRQGSLGHSESISVSSTPQSILKVRRVVRRTPPHTTLTSSPLMARCGSSEVPQSKDGSTIEFESHGRDSVDFHLETPSRRIRFANEDASPSPNSSQTSEATFKEVSKEPQEIAMETTASSVKSVGFKEVVECASEQDSHSADTSLRLELSRSTEEEEEEGESEVQITAAVVDLRGNSDIDEEVLAHEDEDYSSYELDESDNVIAEDSEEEVMMRKSLEKSDKTGSLQERGMIQVAGSSETDNEGSVMRSSPRTSADATEQTNLLQQISQLETTETRLEDSSPPQVSPSKQTYSPLRQSSPGPSPKISPQPTPRISQLHETTDASLTMTPPKSPHTSPLNLPSHSKDTKEVQEQSIIEQGNSYVFSPPAVVRTPQAKGSGKTSSEEVSTPASNFLFSPPLTRSMTKRHSLDVSSVGKSSSNNSALNLSITLRSLRPRSQTGRYTPLSTPHQSPSDSPISFVSPAPSQPTSPKGRRKHKLVPKPLHSMTLRSRTCPLRGTRSAKLPHSAL